jgi:formiminotetrahydrofolate cyclodeaminase
MNNAMKYKRVPYTVARTIGGQNSFCLEEASPEEYFDAAWSGYQNAADTLDEVLAANGYLVDVDENPTGDEEYTQEIRDHVSRLEDEMRNAFIKSLKSAYGYRWTAFDVVR